MLRMFFISYNLTTISLFEEEGVGHNYLIQHSAGSGKTKTIAWLAHQFTNMIDANGAAVFDSIIMVTALLRRKHKVRG